MAEKRGSYCQRYRSEVNRDAYGARRRGVSQ